ncbi:hypothetical protein TRVL_09755 [Trypanosoma vivax]|nr:hypothetical protein TRVL_09755 [Trypanosoma vivax]
MYRKAGRARCNGPRLASWPLRHAGLATQAFASAEGGFDAIVSLCGEFWFCTRRLFPLKVALQDARCASKALAVGRERCVLKTGSENPFWVPGAPLNATRPLARRGAATGAPGVICSLPLPDGYAALAFHYGYGIRGWAPAFLPQLGVRFWVAFGGMAFSPERSTRWDRRACVGRRRFSIFYPQGKRVACLVAVKAAAGPSSPRSPLFPQRRFSLRHSPPKRFANPPRRLCARRFVENLGGVLRLKATPSIERAFLRRGFGGSGRNEFRAARFRPGCQPRFSGGEKDLAGGVLLRFGLPFQTAFGC